MTNRIGADARFWLIVTAIALSAALFRLGLAGYSLWFDEQASMFFAQQPLARLWSSWMLREPNPPLYYSLLKGWVQLFGDGERAVRALSIVAAAGGLFTTALFARACYGDKAGFIAAGLTALSAQQSYYALQARAYALVYLASSCVLFSLLTIDRGLCAGRGWSRSLLVYALGCTICIYLHTTMALLPVICTLSLVIVRRRDFAKNPRLLLPLLAANLGIAVAASWWLDITVRQMIAGAQNTAVFDKVTPWFVIRATLGTLSFAKDPGGARTAIALIATGIVVWQIRRSWPNPTTRLMVTVLGASIAVFALIGWQVPIFLPRTIFWLSVISTALCAGGLAAVHERTARRVAIAGFGLAVALNLTSWLQTREIEDWNGAIARAQSAPGSRLIVQGEAMGLLLNTACHRLNANNCPVPIIAITTPDDRLDGWASGLYPVRTIAVDAIATLPDGRYFIFRKEHYHDLLQTLHARGKGRAIQDDAPLLGPVDRSMLVN